MQEEGGGGEEEEEEGGGRKVDGWVDDALSLILILISLPPPLSFSINTQALPIGRPKDASHTLDPGPEHGPLPRHPSHPPR